MGEGKLCLLKRGHGWTVMELNPQVITTPLDSTIIFFDSGEKISFRFID
jgi:hypothetical protein